MRLTCQRPCQLQGRNDEFLQTQRYPCCLAWLRVSYQTVHFWPPSCPKLSATAFANGAAVGVARADAFLWHKSCPTAANYHVCWIGQRNLRTSIVQSGVCTVPFKDISILAPSLCLLPSLRPLCSPLLQGVTSNLVKGFRLSLHTTEYPYDLLLP